MYLCCLAGQFLCLQCVHAQILLHCWVPYCHSGVDLAKGSAKITCHQDLVLEQIEAVAGVVAEAEAEAEVEVWSNLLNSGQMV